MRHFSVIFKHRATSRLHQKSKGKCKLTCNWDLFFFKVMTLLRMTPEIHQLSLTINDWSWKSPRLKMRLENHNIYNAATKSAFKGGFRLKFNAWKMMKVIFVALHKTFIMQAISRMKKSGNWVIQLNSEFSQVFLMIHWRFNAELGVGNRESKSLKDCVTCLKTENDSRMSVWETC